MVFILIELYSLGHLCAKQENVRTYEERIHFSLGQEWGGVQTVNTLEWMKHGMNKEFNE